MSWLEKSSDALLMRLYTQSTALLAPPTPKASVCLSLSLRQDGSQTRSAQR
jgi:hypothetical protein